MTKDMSQITIDLMTATPSEFDTAYSKAIEEALRVGQRAESDRESICRSFYPSYQYPDMTDAEKMDAARVSEDYFIKRFYDSFVDHKSQYNAIQDTLKQYEKAFDDRGGWSRFFIVRASNGHIHSSMGCSTCNKNGRPTNFGWLPDLSGLNEKDAVDAHGAILCTVCFPSAPVEWTNHYEEQEKKKAAEKCSGSGKSYDPSLPNRTGYYSGNWATCPECSKKVTLTSTMKLRSHKPEK